MTAEEKLQTVIGSQVISLCKLQAQVEQLQKMLEIAAQAQSQQQAPPKDVNNGA